MEEIIITRLSWKWAIRSGVDLEELKQEAHIAYWYCQCEAEKSDKGLPSLYDPRKAAFTTFASTCVQNRLSEFVWQYRRKNPPMEEVDEYIVDMRPSPEDEAYWNQLVRQLPQDARIIYGMIMELQGIPPRQMKSVVRSILRGIDWTGARIDRGLQSIHIMLRQKSHASA